MTTEQAKTLSETAMTRLMDALERGQSDVLNAGSAPARNGHSLR